MTFLVFSERKDDVATRVCELMDAFERLGSVDKCASVVWTLCSSRKCGGERGRSRSALREWRGSHLRSGEERSRALWSRGQPAEENVATLKL